jgi:SNF2 family DNA or RNA helicase
MQLNSVAIQNYILNHTSEALRDRAGDSDILSLDVKENEIVAKVVGNDIYTIKIGLVSGEIKSAKCSCPFDKGPICKHIVNVLINALELSDYGNNSPSEEGHPTDYVIPNFNTRTITTDFFRRYAKHLPTQREINSWYFKAYDLRTNYGNFETGMGYRSQIVEASLQDDTLTLKCSCILNKYKMCEHQGIALLAIAEKEEIELFFNESSRYDLLKQEAKRYGLEGEENLEKYLQIANVKNKIVVESRIKGLFAVDASSSSLLKNSLGINDIPNFGILSENITKQIIVFAEHRYYNDSKPTLYEAKLTKEGKVKNPINECDFANFNYEGNDIEELKFYTSIHKLAAPNDQVKDEQKLQGLREVVKNKLNLEVYRLNTKKSENVTSTSIEPIVVANKKIRVLLKVFDKFPFYEIVPQLFIEERKVPQVQIKLHYNYFILDQGVYYLVDNPQMIRLIQYFKKVEGKLVIHESKFEKFRLEVLAGLENTLKIEYTYLKSATPQQMQESGFINEPEKIIYLTESEDYILITPSFRYNKAEVPVLSQRQLYATDANGEPFTVSRNAQQEEHMIAVLLRQNEDFANQYGQEFYYIHRKRFFEQGWFLDAFEVWQENNYTILGFKELKNNKLNANKAKVAVAVSSGIDWFETSIKVKFGEHDVPLKMLARALKNETRYIELGDGTMGLLPEEWVQKFSAYFRAGEVKDDVLRSSKANFSQIHEIYEAEVLSEDVVNEIDFYNKKVNDFDGISKVEVPKTLKAELRDYQKDGLNWLNFLDEFNFGGCLADDMGLGKTIQIIAFLLAQKEKHGKKERLVNLIVVPTSLIFNWQKEVKRFAPSLKIKTVYGADRVKNHNDFDKFDIILTSYGTLLSDIFHIKEYKFHYVILDESQAIKNPESQRYKTVRLLQAKNRIVMTGTPVENNTFDLYAQLSFVNPGLLGSQQRFRDDYSIPIDKFKDFGRAKELQEKINPFLLRRTKAQVATELPEKTEMVLHCEMGVEQRKVYDAYKKEMQAYLQASKNKKKTMDTMFILAALTKLRQICNSPALLSEEEYYGNHSSKIEALMEDIESKHRHHKILVFSQFVGMLDLIRTELDKKEIQYAYLTGQSKKREDLVEDFQNNEETRIFLISLKAGGVGLNLTEADYVYLVDPWWNPAVENQAIDRCYRIGQTKKVVAIRMICPDTIEEKIMDLQESKRELVNDLIKTDGGALKSLTHTDLMDLFA